mmetsp:Transcript_5289/g.21621  ORF Transcript_5289/g.21621 Transcript_5289/m.21621 type:complete len:262 (-) Transcript_5289:700-1485(-)
MPNLGAGRFFAGDPPWFCAPPRRGDPGAGLGSGNLTPEDPDVPCEGAWGDWFPNTGGSPPLPKPHDCCCCNPGGVWPLAPLAGNVAPPSPPPPGAPQLPPLPPSWPSRPFGPGTGPPLCNPSGAGASPPDASGLLSPRGAGIFLPPLPSAGAGDAGDLATSSFPDPPSFPLRASDSFARDEGESELALPRARALAPPDAPSDAPSAFSGPSSSSFCSAAGLPTSCDTSPPATASARSSSSRSAYMSSTSPNSSKSSWLRSM